MTRRKTALAGIIALLALALAQFSTAAGAQAKITDSSTHSVTHYGPSN
jgi:hypothetical protein